MWIELVREQMLACIEAGHTDLIDKVYCDSDKEKIKNLKKALNII